MALRNFLRHFLASVILTGATHSALAAEVSDFVFTPDTPCASPGFIIDSGKAGPTVLCIAEVGPRNKQGGPDTLEGLRDLPVIAGKLVVVPRFEMPDEDRRAIVARDVFPTKAGEIPALDSARILWQEIESLAPTALIQLAWSVQIRAATADAGDYGNTALQGVTPGAKSMTQAGIDMVNTEIPEASAHWLPVPDPKVGLLVRSASTVLKIDSVILSPSTLVPLPARKEQVRTLIEGMLGSMGMLPAKGTAK